MRLAALTSVLLIASTEATRLNHRSTAVTNAEVQEQLSSLMEEMEHLEELQKEQRTDWGHAWGHAKTILGNLLRKF